MADVDLHQLECFIVVAEELHVGRAAARLHITQPPLTRRIARLERTLGVRLFERTPTGLLLTEPGTVLLERAHQLVQLAENAVERTRRADDGQIGQFVVGYFGSTIFDAVPRLLRGFLAVRPDVALTLQRAAKNVQADALRDGRMHIGFSRYYREEPGLRVRRIRTEPLFAALPARHPLLDTGELRVADLRAQDLVVFPAAPRPGFADEVTGLCSRAGFTARVVREAEDVVTALAYVACAGLVAIVPRSATTIALPGLVYLPLSDAEPQELCALFRAGSSSPVLHSFLRHLDGHTNE
ncbi:LysR family transcriptional regulator [Amycolatopsis sp. NPDC004378]